MKYQIIDASCHTVIVRSAACEIITHGALKLPRKNHHLLNVKVTEEGLVIAKC